MKYTIYVASLILATITTISYAEESSTGTSSVTLATVDRANQLDRIRQQFDTNQPGWKALTADDFTQVNSNPDTWTWRKDSVILCSGKPISVLRTKK